MITLIVAMDENGLIGNKGRLPWSIPEDLRLFKEITTGGIVIMGRKTFDSIGSPLPNRTNIVITHNRDLYYEGALTFIDYLEALDYAEHITRGLYSTVPPLSDIFIIGGRSVYEIYFPYVERIYISLVRGTYQGDTYFPDLDISDFDVVSEIDYKDFVFIELLKKQL